MQRYTRTGFQSNVYGAMFSVTSFYDIKNRAALPVVGLRIEQLLSSFEMSMIIRIHLEPKHMIFKGPFILGPICANCRLSIDNAFPLF